MAAIISVFASLIALLTASMAVVARLPPTGCTTRELLLLSPCLPFISAPPNNLSDTVPSACCEAFSSAYDSGSGICLCYFLREPQILGFPLNRTKLIALSSFCLLGGGMSSEKNSSLDSLCAASRTLPPLQSSKIPGIVEPYDPVDNNTPAPALPPPQSAIISPSAPADELDELDESPPSDESAESPPSRSSASAKSPPSLSSASANSLSLTKDCISLFLTGSLLFLFRMHISFILRAAL